MGNKKLVLASDAVVYKDYVYFMSTEINAIYRYCINENYTEYWNSLPKEPIYKSALCYKIDVFNDKMIFSPMRGEKIWIYDFAKEEWKDYSFPKLDNCNENAKFFQTYAYKNKFFIVGTQYPAIVCIDFDKDNISLNEEPYKPFYQKYAEIKDCYFRRDGVLIENKLFLASCISNAVVIVDLDSNETTVMNIGNSNNRYSGITYVDGKFVLAPRKNTAIVIWDGSNYINEIPFPNEINEDKFSFLGVVGRENSLFFPAMHLEKSLELKLKDSSIEIVDTGRMLFYRKDNEYILSQTVCGDFKFGFEEEVSFKVDMVRVRNIEAFAFWRFDKVMCARETKSIDLQLYMDNLIN